MAVWKKERRDDDLVEDVAKTRGQETGNGVLYHVLEHLGSLVAVYYDLTFGTRDLPGLPRDSRTVDPRKRARHLSAHGSLGTGFSCLSLIRTSTSSRQDHKQHSRSDCGDLGAQRKLWLSPYASAVAEGAQEG
ncbi:hypothetical protein CSUB01_02656 [Colletotrichum sublineola]|uniref:Uncharacterized protein n=1 Tax=Colletotrichum sublineola TaxID=1173701 RepID=A0A066Y0N8_COLSU|nr:hypothetical protein CSUB01_02656 [Colletotrichum sublineola]